MGGKPRKETIPTKAKNSGNVGCVQTTVFDWNQECEYVRVDKTQKNLNVSLRGQIEPVDNSFYSEDQSLCRGKSSLY